MSHDASENILISWFYAQTFLINYKCQKQLCCLFFVETIFSGFELTESWKHLFEKCIFCNIINVHNIAFDQFNASLANNKYACVDTFIRRPSHAKWFESIPLHVYSSMTEDSLSVWLLSQKHICTPDKLLRLSGSHSHQLKGFFSALDQHESFFAWLVNTNLTWATGNAQLMKLVQMLFSKEVWFHSTCDSCRFRKTRFYCIKTAYVGSLGNKTIKLSKWDTYRRRFGNHAAADLMPERTHLRHAPVGFSPLSRHPAGRLETR